MATPQWEMGNGVTPPPAYLHGLPSADTLRIDDLLDFSNNQHLLPNSSTTNHHTLNQHHNASAASCDDCYPQMSSFPEDIYLPSEEAAELEWLSKFMEDSFTDAPYPSAFMPSHASAANNQIPSDPIPVPSRSARSKRSRAPTAAAIAAANWSAAALSHSSSSSTSSSSSSDVSNASVRRRNGGDGGIGVDESGVRRCTHCASEKTPQWRTGPLGPKTLCNACGVRFKSGRLVPEYRPAASPTFVLTQHSNSHRKVMELRRQKEHRQHAVSSASASSRLELIYHDRVMSLS